MPSGRSNLNPARLPISPHPHVYDSFEFTMVLAEGHCSGSCSGSRLSWPEDAPAPPAPVAMVFPLGRPWRERGGPVRVRQALPGEPTGRTARDRITTRYLGMAVWLGGAPPASRTGVLTPCATLHFVS
jgi:hypothetical protein